MLRTVREHPKQYVLTATLSGRDHVSLKFEAVKDDGIKMKRVDDMIVGKYDKHFDLVVRRERDGTLIAFMAPNEATDDSHYEYDKDEWDKTYKGVPVRLVLDDELKVRGGETVSLAKAWESVLSGQRVTARVYDTDRVALTITRAPRAPEGPKPDAPPRAGYVHGAPATRSHNPTAPRPSSPSPSRRSPSPPCKPSLPP